MITFGNNFLIVTQGRLFEQGRLFLVHIYLKWANSDWTQVRPFSVFKIHIMKNSEGAWIPQSFTGMTPIVWNPINFSVVLQISRSFHFQILQKLPRKKKTSPKLLTFLCWYVKVSNEADQLR